MLVYNIGTQPPLGVLTRPHDSSGSVSALTAEKDYGNGSLKLKVEGDSYLALSTTRAKLIETKLKQSDVSSLTCSVMSSSIKPQQKNLQPTHTPSSGISFITANKPGVVTKTSSLSSHIPDKARVLKAEIDSAYDSVLEFKVVSRVRAGIRTVSTEKSVEMSILNSTFKPDSHLDMECNNYLGQGDLVFYVSEEGISPTTRVIPMRDTPSLYAKIIKDKKESTIIGEKVSELSASILESNIGNVGGGGIGELKIVLEVLKGKIYYFQFPDEYLKNMLPSGVATALNKNTLRVRTESYGDVTLYTDKGEIVLRTVPGLRVE